MSTHWDDEFRQFAPSHAIWHPRRWPIGRNVAGAERLASALGGALLVGYGIKRRGVGGWLAAGLGSSLLARAGSGRCALKQAVSPTPIEREVAQEHEWKSAAVYSRSVTIDKPREEVYAYWRALTHLPRFMADIESIEVLDTRRSHWIVKGPLGRRLAWDAEIVDDEPGRRIAWQSTAQAHVRNAGLVTFNDAPGGRGTEVRALLSYEPPGGQIGRAVARLSRREPSPQAHDALRKLKQILETGEIASSAMQKETS